MGRITGYKLSRHVVNILSKETVFPQPILGILINNQKVWPNGNPRGGWISRHCSSNRLHRFARLAPHSSCQLSPSHRERPTSLTTRAPDASRVASIATAEGNRIAIAGVTILQHGSLPRYRLLKSNWSVTVPCANCSALQSKSNIQ